MLIVKYLKDGNDAYKIVAKTNLNNQVKVKIYKMELFFYVKVFECLYTNDYIEESMRLSLDIYFNGYHRIEKFRRKIYGKGS